MSAKTSKKYKIKIRWLSHPPHDNDFEDTDDESRERIYDFRTKQDRDLFLKGVNEALGWSDYEIIKDKVYDE